jgi:hypothetical protein
VSGGTARRLDPAALAVLDLLLSGVSVEQALADATKTPAKEPDLYAAPVVTALGERHASPVLRQLQHGCGRQGVSTRP